MGFDETCNESMITAVQERVKRLCGKDNVLFQVLTDSDQSLFDLYTAQLAVEKVQYLHYCIRVKLLKIEFFINDTQIYVCLYRILRI